MLSQEQQNHLKQCFIEDGGIWNEEWEALLQVSPAYFEAYLKMHRVCLTRKRLSPKIQEFVFLAVAAACTHIHVPAIRAHIKASRALGATMNEMVEVIGITYLLGVHTVNLGLSLLSELMDDLGISRADYQMDDVRLQMKSRFIEQRGFWPEHFSVLVEMDPHFFQEYTDFSSFASVPKVLEPKVRELIICAIDAATNNLYARGTKIHMQNALRLGATVDEVIEMLEITSLMGIHGVTHSAPLLIEEFRQIY
jgi:alkylhydroperoxidase/carboxymuconolactone decarboxylase family protein YurZ